MERVLTLVDREGVDVIAELWSHADPDSLPGILWRLYLLRTWMRKNRESIARLWRVGEPVAPPLPRLPAWTRHRRKTTSHVPPIRFWPARYRRFRRGT